MKYQDYIVDATKAAAAEAFRYAKAVPTDKVEWKPLDAGRSTLELCRELAKCPFWAVELLGEQKEQDWSEEAQAAAAAEMAKMATLEDCEAELNANLATYAETVKNYPDEKLIDTKFLPFEGGRDYTMQEVMDYPRWNFNYHLGQIAYIQILLGDKDMH